MEVKRGLRVVRGPDWEGGNEDGGEGYVGTVVAGARADGGAEEGRHDVATVQWDVGGERHVYRCGAEGKYDLRVIDSAPAAGVVHRRMECSGCGSESIAGCVWRCVHCLRYYLCTPCYMKDRHSVWHHFMRIDSPEKPEQRTRVRCRYQSGRVAARGVFVGARVVRGGDWGWRDQDGGAGREGTVVEIGGWQSESSRSVAVVEWRESGVKNKYRLGHKGKVDLQCRVAAEGGHCYLDHLPLLGSKAPTSSFVCAGDRMRLETDDIDLLRACQEQIGAWNDLLVDFLGRVGLVNRVNLDGRAVHILFGDKGAAGMFIAAAVLKQVEGPDILPDDVVRVIDDMAEVHRLQKAADFGWNDDMALSLGQLGRVERLLKDGSVVLVVNGKRWGMDARCLVPAPGEQAIEDEEYKPEPRAGIDLMLMAMSEEPTPGVLTGAINEGDTRLLTAVFEKWPEKVNTTYRGLSLLHLAVVKGEVAVAQVMLQYNADVSARAATGEMPLHLATYINCYYLVKLLLEKGGDVNARDSAGHTPVHIATFCGYSRLLALYLRQPNCQINLKNTEGNTAVYLSSQTFRCDVTRQLLEAGADPSVIGMHSCNAFLLASIKEFFPGLQIQAEFDHKVINHIKVDDGYTALHVAAHMNYCDQLYFLAAIDVCELNKKTYEGCTALCLASDEGNVGSIECLVGYGADVEAQENKGSTPLYLVVHNKNMKPLSEGTRHLNEFHEYVSGADNSIQDVPVYITVACFLVSEGASLETQSSVGGTPLTLCPPEYHSLLQLFARPERRGQYRGSIPRHPPLGPMWSGRTQKTNVMSDTSGNGDKSLEKKATPAKSEATPTKSETTPTRSEATPPEVSVSGGDSNKTEESEVDSVTGPSCLLCEGPCDITFQPCGHTAMCAECAQPVKRCPICKTPIKSRK